MNKEALFTSKIQTYETPHNLFNKLNNVFNFTLDVACVKETAKCSNYFTPKEDGLKQSWEGNTCWCNPPYNNQTEWIQKAVDERNFNNVKTLILIPARVDTKLWQNIIFKEATCVCFISGRLKFHNCKNSAPFPSALILISRERERERERESLKF